MSLRLCVFASSLMLASAAAAQEQPRLRADVRTLIPRPRSGAPVPVEARLNWSGTRLLEGRLEVVVRDGNDVLVRWRSPELALAGGAQAFRFLLPPFRSEGRGDEVRADLAFLTADGRLPLEGVPLPAPGGNARTLVIAFPSPEETTDQRGFDAVQALRLETFDPAPFDSAQGRAGEGERTLRTGVASFPPEDLPVHPLAFCAYDVLLLSGDGFARLKPPQLDAAARWVAAGGSVLLMPRGGLEPHHAAFANALAGESAYALGPAGSLVQAPGREPGGMAARHVAGLGRAVVALAPIASDTPDWRAAVAFLWKARANQVKDFSEKGKWDPRAQSISGEAIPLVHVPRPFPGTGELIQALMPKEVRVVPFGTIVTILVLFVLAVGPGDWFLLGLLRRRKYTWILFPAVCLGFTVFTVVLSERAMGSTDHRRGLVFVDLGPGGKVLRVNRIDQIFAAKESERVEERKDALWTPVGLATVNSDTYRRNGYRYQRGYTPDGGTGPAPWFEGSLPGRYATAQAIRQWTPQVNRVMSFETVNASIPLNWDRMAGVDVYNLPQIEISSMIAPEFPVPEAAGVAVARSVQWLYPMLGPGGEKILWDQILSLSVAPREGFFSVVSSLSPNGAAEMEDLPVFDATEKNAWMLVVVVREGEDWVVYRRVFGEKP